MKRDDFIFQIVNFPFISSNIPATPAYCIFISQVICYSRAGARYTDFRDQLIDANCGGFLLVYICIIKSGELRSH